MAHVNEQSQFKPKKCPICEKTDQVIPIMYGLPTEKGFENARSGRVAIGGCLVGGNDPKWFCKRDKEAFR